MNTRRHIPELDGLRGLAILAVLVWHYIAAPLNAQHVAPALAGWFSLTWSGVDLFFVLSGFLIGGILLDSQGQTGYLRDFYTRRFFRIVPLYAAWLALFVVLSAVASGEAARLFAEPLPFWSYLTFTQNIAAAGATHHGSPWLGITWSLAIEEQFYLVLPFLLRAIPRRYLGHVLLLLVGAASVFRVVTLALVPATSWGVSLLLVARIDALGLGVLCAFIMRHTPAVAFLKAHRRMLYAALLGLMCVIPPAHGITMLTYGYSLLALSYAGVLLIAVTEQSGPVTHIARFRPLHKLGALAYGVYLFHEGINGLAHALLLNQAPHVHTPAGALVTAAALGLTLLVAAASWRWFEKPLIRLGRGQGGAHRNVTVMTDATS